MRRWNASLAAALATAPLAVLGSGCGQSRPFTQAAAHPARPVGLEPVPSIASTINGGYPEGAPPAAPSTPRDRPVIAPDDSPTRLAAIDRPIPADQAANTPPTPEPIRGDSPAAQPGMIQDTAAAAPAPDASVAPASIPADDPTEPLELPPLEDAAPAAAAQPDPVPVESAPQPQAASEPFVPPQPATNPPAPDQAATQAAPAPAPVQAPVDNAVQATSAAAPEAPPGKPVAEWAARVNDDIITWTELRTAVQDRLWQLPADQRPGPEVRDAIASTVLDQLIDRALIIQEARRKELKEAKSWDAIKKAIDKEWKADRLPAYMKQFKASNQADLERILAEKRVELADLKEAYVHSSIARAYLLEKIGPKLHVDLPEQRAYYAEHRNSYHREAQITWREILIRFDRHPDHPTAFRKAQQAIDLVRRGQPFAEVARQYSEGANADVGGLWETAPDAYAIASVNQLLGTLPIGQPSNPIEGPEGYHIVRIEARRAAGPRPFSEVQSEIREVLLRKKQEQAFAGYVENLHRNAVITTVFQNYRPRGPLSQ